MADYGSATGLKASASTPSTPGDLVQDPTGPVVAGRDVDEVMADCPGLERRQIGPPLRECAVVIREVRHASGEQFVADCLNSSVNTRELSGKDSIAGSYILD